MHDREIKNTTNNCTPSEYLCRLITTSVVLSHFCSHLLLPVSFAVVLLSPSVTISLSHSLSLFLSLALELCFVWLRIYSCVTLVLWFRFIRWLHAFDDAAVVCLLFDSFISMHIRTSIQQLRSAFVYESVTWIYLVNCAGTTARQTTCAQIESTRFFPRFHQLAPSLVPSRFACLWLRCAKVSFFSLSHVSTVRCLVR